MTLGQGRARFKPNEFTWIWLATAVLFAVSRIVAPNTVTGTSIRLMIPFASILAIAAIGQALVIRQRGIDLSVAGVMSLSGLLVSKLVAVQGAASVVSVVIVLAICAAIGLVTGLVITRLGLTPLVATLAVNALLLGVIQSYSDGVPVEAPSALNRFALDSTVTIPNTALIALVILVISWLVIGRTVAGRRFVAVGENADTARAAGIGVGRYQMATYVFAAICFGLAGVLLASYVQTAVPNAGDSYLLPVIAAVVVGGTPFTGGRGSVIATAVAAIFLSQLIALVLALGAPSSVQFLVQSVAIAVATAIRQVRWSGLRRRTAPHRPVAVATT